MDVKTAQEIFKAQADETLVTAAEALVAAGAAAWTMDPEVDDVVGLVKVKRGMLTNAAYVVVYPDGGWESSITLEADGEGL
jgi:hypothetical protein